MVTRLVRFVFTLVLATAVLFSATAAAAQPEAPVDLRIWTETESGTPVYDVCYTLVDASNLGCDENLDGSVLFQDIQPGRYYIEPSYPNGSLYYVEPFTILVDQYHTDHIALAYEFTNGGGNSTTGSTDVLLLTRDARTGESLTDVCFELVGYSNIGCDENADGRVSFADIPFGQHTIRQTHSPDGYRSMNDYTVMIMPTGLNDPFTILLSQSRNQAPRTALNVSVVFYDAQTGNTVQSPENCAQFWQENEPTSQVGCDEDIVDGQVDFMHLKFDPYDDSYAMDVTVVCDYDLVATQYFDMLWVGESTLLVFVEVTPNYKNCT